MLSLAAFVAILAPVMLVVGGAGFFAGVHGGVHNYAATGLTVIFGALVVMAFSIPITMALWFAPALVIFHGLKPVEGLKTSFFACHRNIIPFLLYAAIVLILSMVASIPFLLGFLILMPVVVASVYVSYRDIFFAK